MRWLTYRRAPYGSGTNLTRGDVLSMELGEILAWWDWLQDTWAKEDAAARRR